MSDVSEMEWTIAPLTPFGIAVTADIPGTDIRTIPIPDLQDWVARNRVVVLRGFAPLTGDAMPEYCKNLGEILEWDFGSINNLVVKPDAKNYLFTNREVPFHWDGAFVGRIPHYIFFECEVAPPPSSGGETLFTDTIWIRERATPEQNARWESISITYSTEKIVHYGGSFTSPLLARHPISGAPVVRYAEPVNDLNPVTLEIHGLPEEKQPEFLAEMHALLHDPALCYAHVWQDGDILIADNHATLHGRRAFTQPERRHIRRVNIL